MSSVLAYLSLHISEKLLPVAVMINNLGGLSILESNIIAEEVLDQLSASGLDIRRVVVGSFVTSLDGPGFSVTILKLQPRFEELIDATTTAPAWPSHVSPLSKANSVTEQLVKLEVKDVNKGNGSPLLPGKHDPVGKFSSSLLTLSPES